MPIIFSNLTCNFPYSLDIRNLQEQVKKEFCCQILFWSFTVWINCSSDLKVGQKNFGYKIPKLDQYFCHCTVVIWEQFSECFPLENYLHYKLCFNNFECEDSYNPRPHKNRHLAQQLTRHRLDSWTGSYKLRQMVNGKFTNP